MGRALPASGVVLEDLPVARGEEVGKVREEAAARAEDPTELPQHEKGILLGEMVKHEEGQREIEVAVRKHRQRRLLDVVQPHVRHAGQPAPRSLEHLGADVHAVHLAAMGCKVSLETADAAAEIEHPPVRLKKPPQLLGVLAALVLEPRGVRPVADGVEGVDAREVVPGLRVPPGILRRREARSGRRRAPAAAEAVPEARHGFTSSDRLAVDAGRGGRG